MAVFAVHEVIDHASLYGTWTVQSVERSEIFNRVRLVFCSTSRMPCDSNWEDSGGQSFVKDFFIGFVVFEGSCSRFKSVPRVCMINFKVSASIKAVGETEEIHLQQAHFLDG